MHSILNDINFVLDTVDLQILLIIKYTIFSLLFSKKVMFFKNITHEEKKIQIRERKKNQIKFHVIKNEEKNANLNSRIILNQVIQIID